MRRLRASLVQGGPAQQDFPPRGVVEADDAEHGLRARGGRLLAEEGAAAAGLREPGEWAAGRRKSAPRAARRSAATRAAAATPPTAAAPARASCAELDDVYGVTLAAESVVNPDCEAQLDADEADFEAFDLPRQGTLEHAPRASAPSSLGRESSSGGGVGGGDSGRSSIQRLGARLSLLTFRREPSASGPSAMALQREESPPRRAAASQPDSRGRRPLTEDGEAAIEDPEAWATERRRSRDARARKPCAVLSPADPSSDPRAGHSAVALDDVYADTAQLVVVINPRAPSQPDAGAEDACELGSTPAFNARSSLVSRLSARLSLGSARGARSGDSSSGDSGSGRGPPAGGAKSKVEEGDESERAKATKAETRSRGASVFGMGLDAVGGAAGRLRLSFRGLATPPPPSSPPPPPTSVGSAHSNRRQSARGQYPAQVGPITDPATRAAKRGERRGSNTRSRVSFGEGTAPFVPSRASMDAVYAAPCEQEKLVVINPGVHPSSDSSAIADPAAWASARVRTSRDKRKARALSETLAVLAIGAIRPSPTSVDEVYPSVQDQVVESSPAHEANSSDLVKFGLPLPAPALVPSHATLDAVYTPREEEELVVGNPGAHPSSDSSAIADPAAWAGARQRKSSHKGPGVAARGASVVSRSSVEAVISSSPASYDDLFPAASTEELVVSSPALEASSSDLVKVGLPLPAPALVPSQATLDAVYVPHEEEELVVGNPGAHPSSDSSAIADPAAWAGARQRKSSRKGPGVGARGASVVSRSSVEAVISWSPASYDDLFPAASTEELVVSSPALKASSSDLVKVGLPLPAPALVPSEASLDAVYVPREEKELVVGNPGAHPSSDSSAIADPAAWAGARQRKSSRIGPGVAALGALTLPPSSPKAVISCSPASYDDLFPAASTEELVASSPALEASSSDLVKFGLPLPAPALVPSEASLDAVYVPREEKELVVGNPGAHPSSDSSAIADPAAWAGARQRKSSRIGPGAAARGASTLPPSSPEAVISFSPASYDDLFLAASTEELVVSSPAVEVSSPAVEASPADLYFVGLASLGSRGSLHEKLVDTSAAVVLDSSAEAGGASSSAERRCAATAPERRLHPAAAGCEQALQAPEALPDGDDDTDGDDASEDQSSKRGSARRSNFGLIRKGLARLSAARTSLSRPKAARQEAEPTRQVQAKLDARRLQVEQWYPAGVDFRASAKPVWLPLLGRDPAAPFAELDFGDKVRMVAGDDSVWSD